MRATTALRKITGLWLTRLKILCIQGGQGAGKTYSILQLLIDRASGTANSEVYIASHELSKMRRTVIKDFVKIMQQVGLWDPARMKAGTYYEFPNGSFIEFIGLDKVDVGKGLRSDIVFINEANKVPFEAYRELTSRAKRIILDYNPNAVFWAHEELIPREDCGFLKLTFQDNECLSDEERSEILRYKDKAYGEDGELLSEYWANKWKIYGLGEVGGIEGRIFEWEPIDYSEYLRLDYVAHFASDWGTADPWGILEAKYRDNTLWLHELNYQSENQIRKRLAEAGVQKVGEGLVTWKFAQLGIPKSSYVVCDNNRHEKIVALRRAGYDYAIAAPKPKGSILDGIDLLKNLKVYYTSTSKNLEYEQLNYRWDRDRNNIAVEKPVDADNHLIDCARYIVLFLQKQGVINIV